MVGEEQSWIIELVPPHLPRAPLPPSKICDMVAVARIINATLVIPELDKRSFWQDTSNFSDVFDQDHFISSLANDVKVIRKLPKELANATRAVKHFRSWSGIDLELVNTKKAISIRRTDWQSLPRS
ncbi:O-fucosyltransferase 7-like isoform X1 [Camellia sinensis]|uniref:O-fucosyltransferase 7-like isoform X1 n=1 Tax=Camellia sinensis TaxID=4442 RepID=UPI001036A569|nr:O-fucosyltransferase 7-like isoform X1 [Camellia sinensis]